MQRSSRGVRGIAGTRARDDPRGTGPRERRSRVQGKLAGRARRQPHADRAGPPRRPGGVKLAHALDVFAIQVSGRLASTSAPPPAASPTSCCAARRRGRASTSATPADWKLPSNPASSSSSAQRTCAHRRSAPRGHARVRGDDGRVVHFDAAGVSVVAPPARRRSRRPGQPQFEAGARRGKGGLVHDAAVHAGDRRNRLTAAMRRD